MYLLRCPCCEDLREEEEFACSGEAFVARPSRPETIDDEAWAEYLFMRRNPKGWHWELWFHTTGCRKFFVVRRNTATLELGGAWTLAEARALYDAEEGKR